MGITPMHGMSVAGRRGEVLWKGSFTGIGQQRTYDTCAVRFGLLVPFALGDVVHVAVGRGDAAVEDEGKGRALTDALLGQPEVIERLRRVRSQPDTRDQEFGPAPGLRKWLRGNPEDHILAIR
jgi:hypothetical protein